MQMKLAPARVYSVNVSGPLKDVLYAGHVVRTGFFKSAVGGEAYAGKLGIQGDAQADLSVHGGPEKSVYFYPQEHYAAWEGLLGSEPLPPGSFGENITSVGLLETEVFVGDLLRIGTATLQVVQPRSPCYKLQIRFERPDMTALFFRHGKPGWYASVLQEGAFSADDEIVVIDRAPEKVTIADVWSCSVQSELDNDLIERITQLRVLPQFWKNRVGRYSSD